MSCRYLYTLGMPCLHTPVKLITTQGNAFSQCGTIQNVSDYRRARSLSPARKCVFQWHARWKCRKVFCIITLHRCIVVIRYDVISERKLQRSRLRLVDSKLCALNHMLILFHSCFDRVTISSGTQTDAFVVNEKEMFISNLCKCIVNVKYISKHFGLFV